MNENEMINLFRHWYENVATEEQRRSTPDAKEMAFMQWYDHVSKIKEIAGDLADEAEKRFEAASKPKKLH